jgi:ABC-type transporter Mla subunit MlaD
MIEANKYKLGVFVIIGVTLFFVGLFLLGLKDIFIPKIHLMTLFKESVQGLESGASVKYRGVPIGKVSAISIRASDKLIRVDMQISLDAIRRGAKGKPVSSADIAFFKDFFEREVKNGLRCRLEMAGITGMKFVEIDYYPKSKIETAEIEKRNDVFFLPSTPSFMHNITDTLARIGNIRYKEISENMLQAIKGVNDIVRDPKIKNLITRIDNVGKNLEQSTKNINNALTEDKLKKITSELTKSLDSFDALAIKLKEQLDAAKISETSNAFRNAAESVTSAKQSLNDTLLKVEETLDSITQFVNYLDKDPSSIIKGKHAPTILKEEDNTK